MDDDRISNLPPFIIHQIMSKRLLTGCSFHGLIPDTLGSLTQLVNLNLNSNSFSGPIPASIGDLTKLSFWKKSAHRTTLAFTFQLRNEIDACIFSYNQLIGPLPNLNLSYVDMSNNSFEGSTIPPRFSSLQSLTTLYISVFTHSLTQ
ncbi:hypothetical protein Patl1_27877 [Pistacia atlantica]|uniref:Uncharacterized protein n=1 Tax=Pistacia atlantica TaxID=434234 RepID=A0ACC1BD21_9ROSI|nr:hypothetical protein Patl1_27877 [Pistacia atlantica]